MENQSQNHASRRRDRRNRKPNQHSHRQSGSPAGGSPRNNGGRHRSSRSRSRTPKEKPLTPLQKILNVLTFGLLKKSKPSKKASRTAKKPRVSTLEKRPHETQKPKRQRAELTTNRLYVGNLAYAATEADLEDLFKGAGNVISVEVVTNPRTQQSKGFAFIEMGSLDEAKRAVHILDEKDFMGRRLAIKGARETSSTRPNRDADNTDNTDEVVTVSSAEDSY